MSLTVSGVTPACLRCAVSLLGQRLHDQGLVLGRAYVDAVAAAGAVHGGNGQMRTSYPGEPVAALVSKAGGSASQLRLRSSQHRPDDGVRADEGALVALDAFFRQPFRHIDGNAALLLGRGPRGNVPSSRPFMKALTGSLSPSLPVHRASRPCSMNSGSVLLGCRRLIGWRSSSPSGTSIFMMSPVPRVDGGDVHVDDVLALVAVGLRQPHPSDI